VKLVSATRTPEKHGLKDMRRFITFGASPRASINLTEGARALAMLRGRSYALPEDMTDTGAGRAAPSRDAFLRSAVRRPDPDSLIEKIMANSRSGQTPGT
jgi:MoxR-like ATPase